MSMKAKNRTFWTYMRQNQPWASVGITILTTLIGIVSFLEGAPLIGWFMVLTFAVFWGECYADWKRESR